MCTSMRGSLSERPLGLAGILTGLRTWRNRSGFYNVTVSATIGRR
jgi:hypothetical protein